MIDTGHIDALVTTFARNPEHPVINFHVAEEYKRHNQLASAISFYLRCAEFGHDTHHAYVYTSLLQIANCFEIQKERPWTVSNSLLQAIAYMPSRPEAWFLLARFYERSHNWQEAYTHATVGFSFTRFGHSLLPADVQYPGEYGLLFEKYVAGWWIGRREESITGFTDLLDKYEMSQEFVESCLNNLQRIR